MTPYLSKKPVVVQGGHKPGKTWKPGILENSLNIENSWNSRKFVQLQGKL